MQVTAKILKIALLSCVFLTSGGQARKPAVKEKAIAVMAPETMAHWSGRVARGIGDHIDYPATQQGRPVAEGIVKVGFVCSYDGRPAQISVLQTSGSAQLDRSAMDAVRGVHSLHPLPDAVTPHRPLQAWVYFAATESHQREMIRRLDQELAVASSAKAGQQLAEADPIVIAVK